MQHLPHQGHDGAVCRAPLRAQVLLLLPPLAHGGGAGVQVPGMRHYCPSDAPLAPSCRVRGLGKP